MFQGGYNPSASYHRSSYILDLDGGIFTPAASMENSRAYHVCGPVTISE